MKTSKILRDEMRLQAHRSTAYDNHKKQLKKAQAKIIVLASTGVKGEELERKAQAILKKEIKVIDLEKDASEQLEVISESAKNN